MTNYRIYTFPNGRNAFVKESDINDAIEAGKELLIICNSWSGGYAYAIGATLEPNMYSNDPHEMCYNMYGYDIKDKEFTTEELSKFYKVIFTSGERVMMMSGDEATAYQGGAFIDWDTEDYKVAEKYRINNNLSFSDEVSDSEIRRTRATINEVATVNMLGRTDTKNKVQAMINYGILSSKALKYCKE